MLRPRAKAAAHQVPGQQLPNELLGGALPALLFSRVFASLLVGYGGCADGEGSPVRASSVGLRDLRNASAEPPAMRALPSLATLRRAGSDASFEVVRSF